MATKRSKTSVHQSTPSLWTSFSGGCREESKRFNTPTPYVSRAHLTLTTLGSRPKRTAPAQKSSNINKTKGKKSCLFKSNNWENRSFFSTLSWSQVEELTASKLNESSVSRSINRSLFTNHVKCRLLSVKRIITKFVAVFNRKSIWKWGKTGEKNQRIIKNKMIVLKFSRDLKKNCLHLSGQPN